ncbi:Apoptosis inhibitor 5 [Dinochytrium kinnereticum]|nr:Apoptosis inhibitor 5 [Dinochytrium kinnereticum]
MARISTPDEFYAATSRLMDIPLKGLKPSKEDEAAYSIVLSAVLNVSLKGLATAAIPKYFFYFPSCQDAAMEAHLDLCEDDDAKIRREAIRGLPLLCKDTPRFVAKVADVLCQLLQTDAKDEEAVVKGSLVACWIRSPRATCAAIFQQAIAGLPEVRRRAINFISVDLASSNQSALITSSDPAFIAQFASDLTRLFQTVDAVDATQAKLLLESFGKVAAGASAEQFEMVLGVFVAAVDVPKPYETQSLDCISKLATCLHSCTSFFKRGAKSTPFISLLITKVFAPASFSALPSDQKRTQALRIASDAFKWGVDGSISALVLRTLKGLFLTHEVKNPAALTDLTIYSRLECLLYCLYELTLQHPESFTADETELIEIFKSVYSTCLTVSSDRSNNPINSPNDKRAFDNTFSLIKELLKPVKLRSRLLNLSLSWHKEPAKTQPAAPVVTLKKPVPTIGLKRPMLGTDDKGVKKLKVDNTVGKGKVGAVQIAASGAGRGGKVQAVSINGVTGAMRGAMTKPGTTHATAGIGRGGKAQPVNGGVARSAPAASLNRQNKPQGKQMAVGRGMPQENSQTSQVNRPISGPVGVSSALTQGRVVSVKGAAIIPQQEKVTLNRKALAPAAGEVRGPTPTVSASIAVGARSIVGKSASGVVGMGGLGQGRVVMRVGAGVNVSGMAGLQNQGNGGVGGGKGPAGGVAKAFGRGGSRGGWRGRR